jgi:hypothetical protein
MSEFNPASTSRRPQQVADTNDLAAQLTNLMPVLQLIQAQAWTQAPPTMPGFLNPQQAAMADQLAATEFVESLTAAVLRSVAGYVEANIEKNAGLQSCLGIVIQAAQYFGARDFARAFDCAWQAYRAIAHMRSTDPQLPPLHFSDTVREGGSRVAGASIH